MHQNHKQNHHMEKKKYCYKIKFQRIYRIRRNSYHGCSFISVSSPPTILSDDSTPQISGKSLIVNEFEQQTRIFLPSRPHCELRKKFSCSCGMSRLKRLFSERHCCTSIQVPFLLSGVIHGLFGVPAVDGSTWSCYC